MTQVSAAALIKRNTVSLFRSCQTKAQYLLNAKCGVFGGVWAHKELHLLGNGHSSENMSEFITTEYYMYI